MTLFYCPKDRTHGASTAPKPFSKGGWLVCGTCETRMVRYDPEPIITNYVHPPIPERSSDWSAARRGYEPGSLQGRGPTERAAVIDLLDQEDEREEERAHVDRSTESNLTLERGWPPRG